MSTLIQGGEVVTAEEVVRADVLIEGEVIIDVGHIERRPGTTVIDAVGRYILPGGVDPHVHFQTPSGGVVTCDTFSSGTAAAAYGGTTTALHFCVQARGERFRETIARWRRQLDQSPPIIDVSFHLLLTDWEGGGGEEELALLVADGVTSVKLFLAGEFAVDGGVLWRSLEAAERHGVRVMTHAEDGEVIEALVMRALTNGNVEPRYHGATRPPATEAIATDRVVRLAEHTGASVYVVHISCREALDCVVSGRARGADVSGETCPQYLILDSGVLEQEPLEAAKYVFTPPPRTVADQGALWAAAQNGTISTIGSDHGGYLLAEKRRGSDFTAIPQGITGIETRLPLIHHFGVGTGRLTLPRMVDLLATKPARLFGAYPRKGTVAVGSDADLVVFDPGASYTIAASAQHSATDYSPYEGLTVRGAVERVLVRGTTVLDAGQLRVDPGYGEWVPRSRVGGQLESRANRPAAAADL